MMMKLPIQEQEEINSKEVQGEDEWIHFISSDIQALWYFHAHS